MSVDVSDGFLIRIRDDVRSFDGDALLVGGSPLTAMRLTDRARALLVGRQLWVSGPASTMLADRLLTANIADPVVSAVEPVAPDHLTVVLPTRDRAEQLERALRALGSTLACIVVDDASDDPAAVAGVAAAYGAAVIRAERNGGPAAARNLGLTQVHTPYVAFVDCDVEVKPGALMALARHFVDPHVAMVAPRIVHHTVQARSRWFQRYDDVAGSLSLGERGCSVRPGAAVGWLPSACLVARVASLGSGFDSSMRVGEDVDLVWRLVASGHRVRYDPDHYALHETRSTLRGWLGRKFVYGTGGAALAQRHGSNVAVAALSTDFAMAGAALLLRRWWSVPLAAVIVARGSGRLRNQLATPDFSILDSSRIAVQGLSWALRQETALLLRHWWPPALVACLASRSARRAVATALVVDAVEAFKERAEQPIAVTLAGRRFADLSYGAGLWWGMLRHRSLAAVQVRVLRRRSG